MKPLLIMESTHAVIRTEKEFRQRGISCRVIPVPRAISPHCGMALEVSEDDLARARTVCEELEFAVSVYP